MSGTYCDHVRAGDEFVRRWIVKLGGIIRAAARYQNSPVVQERCRVSGAAPSHVRTRQDLFARLVEDLGRIDCTAPRERTSTGDQNAPVREQCGSMIQPIRTEMAGEMKFAFGRIVNFDLQEAAACDQHAAVRKQRGGLAMTARCHRAGFGKGVG